MSNKQKSRSFYFKIVSPSFLYFLHQSKVTQQHLHRKSINMINIEVIKVALIFTNAVMYFEWNFSLFFAILFFYHCQTSLCSSSYHNYNSCVSVCVCKCVSVCAWEREREFVLVRVRTCTIDVWGHCCCKTLLVHLATNLWHLHVQHTHIYTYTHALSHALTCIKHTHIHSRKHAISHLGTDPLSLSHTHTYTHTHIHSHTRSSS